MIYGTDYYPEHWEKGSIEADAELMAQAGINLVRMGEFAWSRLEPCEGQYNFEWLDNAIEILSKYGIKAMLGTPSAAAPQWVMDKTDAYPLDIHGIKKGFGTRRHYCPNNAEYRKYAVKIAGEMAKHYSKNPNVTAWQIDNEFSGRCFCENCRKAFSSWLERKYKTIDELNRRWGTVFWSQEYRAFNSVILPRYPANEGFPSSIHNHNPSLVLDYYRFISDSYVEFQQLQLDEISKYSPLPATHNMMGHFGEINYFDLGNNLDFVSWDCYPKDMWTDHNYLDTAMAHDLMRGIKNSPFWVTEQQSGPCGWQYLSRTPKPNRLKLWAYQSLAHGANALIFFRWRACSFGTEQYWYGILDHDSVPRRRYREIAELGKELKETGEFFEKSKNANEVLLVKSFDNLWSHSVQWHSRGFDYTRFLLDWYKGFAENHIGVDVSSPETPFEGYKAVCLPAFCIAGEAFAEKCCRYVQEGGTLILTFRSGVKNTDNCMTALTLPGVFADLAGVSVEEFDALRDLAAVKVTGADFEGEAKLWCDILELHGAKAVLKYDSEFYKGTPAVTLNSKGAGQVWYAGCDLDSAAMKRLCALIGEKSGLKKALPCEAKGVEAVIRIFDGCEYTVLLNHNDYEVQAGEHTLAPFQVKTVKGRCF